MGGRRSNFEIERAARWAWQHDAQQVAHGVITLFDDAFDGFARPEAKQSRGVKLKLDWAHRRVKLGAQYFHPRPILAAEMGNVQTLPDGHLIVSWGNVGVLSEFDADETWITDASMRCLTYRAFRFRWTGIHATPPALTAGRLGKLGNVTLYASWNGDTRTMYWRVFTGSSSAHLRPVGVATRRGFETAILVPSPQCYLAVAALDASGRWRRARWRLVEPMGQHNISTRYNAAVAQCGGRCPIEAGLLGRLADHERGHGRLPFDRRRLADVGRRKAPPSSRCQLRSRFRARTAEPRKPTPRPCPSLDQVVGYAWPCQVISWLRGRSSTSDTARTPRRRPCVSRPFAR